MLLKYFYDDQLAHASYMVGCQRAGEAVIVDPGRDVARYLDAAKQAGLKIVAVAETHIHADYVSGARELADRVNAKLYVSDEGPAEWKYEYLYQYEHQALHDGEHFTVGKLRFDVLHTPGHTPESISFLLTDQGGGADQPMGIFTGDFVFVGSIGRPDLLEEAAGMVGTAQSGAHELFHSAKRFKSLPDFLQVWPAHGAGSACGKGLGAVPSSTVGYEKHFNPALQFTDEDEFVRYILADQPEAPKYFAVMKRVNKQGPRILAAEQHDQRLAVTSLPQAIGSGTVIDLSASSDFATAHVPGTINIPLDMLAAWAGWLVDYDRPTFILGKPNQLDEAIRILHKIGVDDIAGTFDDHQVKAAGLATEAYASQSPEQVAARLEAGDVRVIDVRSDEEWKAGHIEQAQHRFLGRLPKYLSDFSTNDELVVHCRGGARAAIAASVLQAAGFKRVTNLAGGYIAWKKDGQPSVQLQPVLS